MGDVVSQLSQEDILVALQQCSGCFYNLVGALEDSMRKPTDNLSVAPETVSFQATTSEIPIQQTILGKSFFSVLFENELSSSIYFF